MPLFALLVVACMKGMNLSPPDPYDDAFFLTACATLSTIRLCCQRH